MKLIAGPGEAAARAAVGWSSSFRSSTRTCANVRFDKQPRAFGLDNVVMNQPFSACVHATVSTRGDGQVVEERERESSEVPA